MLSITRKQQTGDGEGYETVEAGIYRVRLINVEEVAGTQGYDGKEPEPRYKWTFMVVEPGYENHPNGQQRMVRVWTSQRTGTNKTTGKPAKAVLFVEALLGRSLEDNETIQLADVLEHECNAFLTVSADGKYNNIDSLAPLRGGPHTHEAKGPTFAQRQAQKQAVTPVEVPELRGTLTNLAEELDDAGEPSQKQILSFPRRRMTALAECQGMEFWTDEFAEQWRVGIHGEERGKVPFTQLTAKEQYAEVKALEEWASGADIPFI